MAPTNHPRSITELNELSVPTTYDPARSFKDQLRAIDTLREQSTTARKKGDLENAYVFLARAATVIVEKLPDHSQYNILSNKQKTDLAKNGQTMLRALEELKPQLVQRYEDYSASKLDSKKRRDGAAKAVSTPAEKMPRTPTSMEDTAAPRAAATSTKPTPGVTVMLSEAQERERLIENERAQRQRERDHGRSSRPESKIPTPVPTPRRQDTIALTESRQQPLSDHSVNITPSGRTRKESELRDNMLQLQDAYDAELRDRLEDPASLDETTRMRQALDVVENTGVAERMWIEEKDRISQQQGQTSTLKRELRDQAALQEERLNQVREIFARRALTQERRHAEMEAREKAEREERAEWARQQYAAQIVKDKVAREVKRRAEEEAAAAAEVAAAAERQRKATEVQARIAKETEERAIQRAAAEKARREEDELQRAARVAADRATARRAESYAPNLMPSQPTPQPTGREYSTPVVSNSGSRAPLTPVGYPNLPSTTHTLIDNRPQPTVSIPYLPQKKQDTLLAGLSPLPLESPTRSRHSFDEHRDGSKRTYPSPITTTSPPPRDLLPFINSSITYPSLMTQHQKAQGYQPSKGSMFAPNEPSPDDTPHALLFQPNGVTEVPPRPEPPATSGWGSSVRSLDPSRPAHLPPRSPYADYTGTAGPPPAPRLGHLLNGATPRRLRTVILPMSTLPRFLSIASLNTVQKKETCGLLLGKLVGNSFRISTLLVPKQTATENTCSMTHEELVAEFQEKRNLITLGWIHTHPTQSCFMSSLDLHTHSGYQSSLPEAVAIVCAPKHTPNFGIFRLTDPPGLPLIIACRDKSAFHPHSDSEPIYTDADNEHVQMVEDAYLEIIDLR